MMMILMIIDHDGHDDHEDDDESETRMARGRRIRPDQVNKTQHKVSRSGTLVVELVVLLLLVVLLAHTSSRANATIGTETHRAGSCYQRCAGVGLVGQLSSYYE